MGLMEAMMVMFNHLRSRSSSSLPSLGGCCPGGAAFQGFMHLLLLHAASDPVKAPSQA